jgi:hypothetical protein
VQLKEDGLAEAVLGSALSKCSDDLEAQHELMKLLAKREAPDADRLARELATSIEEGNWTWEMRLILASRQAYSMERAGKIAGEWDCFSRLCTPCKEAWKYALSFELQAQEDERHRDWHLSQGAFSFSKVAENELREKVFAPFRAQMPNTAKETFEDKKLCRFVYEGGLLSLGEMIWCIEKAREKPNSLLNSFLQARFPQVLSSRFLSKMSQLNKIGTPSRHVWGPRDATKAHALAKSVIEALN